MKRLKSFISKKPYFLPVVAGFVLVGAVLTQAAFGAGTATLTLTPASGSYDINTEFNVVVKENSGSEGVNSVQADLTYDASKLQFVNLNTTGSPFTTCVQTTGGGGNITIACAKLDGTTTGTQTVGTVTFKALVNTGSSGVTFKASSAIVSGSSNTNVWNGSTAGGTYAFTAPASPTPTPKCPTGQTGTPPNCVTPSTGGSGSTTPSNNNQPKNTSGSSSSTTPTTDGSSNSTTVPTTVDQNGSAEGGSMVAVRVLDSKGKPVTGASVTLGDVTVKTDDTGVASFVSIKPGKYKVTAKTNNGHVLSEVTVKPSTGTAAVQSFDLKFKAPNYTLIYFGLGLVVLIGAGVVGFIILKNIKGKGGPFAGSGHKGMMDGSSMGSNSGSSDIASSITTNTDSSDDKFAKIKTETPNPSAVITPKGS